MRQLIIAAACLLVTSGAVFAQAGTPQGDSINPHPSSSASSNDKSKNPSAVTTGSVMQSGSHSVRKPKRKH